MRDRNTQLAKQRAHIESLQTETEEAFQLSIELLARAAEIHDEETGDHILRVNEYSYYIANLLDMPFEWCDEIRYSAQLHDVGKMSVDAARPQKERRARRRRARGNEAPHGLRLSDFVGPRRG